MYGEKLEYLNVKYSDEVQIGVGVSMVELPSVVSEGKRTKCFNYSGKFILSTKDYIARKQCEIERVK